MLNFPKINYIGNKEKIAEWIVSFFPSDTKSVFDAFAGGSSVGFEAKKKGFQVISNDILKINYCIAKSLIENCDQKLTQEDISIIFEGTPKEGFMTEHYTEVFFFKNECMELDLYRENIEKLENEYKKSIAFALMRRAMIRKMPYSRFNLDWNTIKQLRDEEYSYEKYKRKRAYHNESFKTHFLENIMEYNNAIFDNKEQNIALNDDVFNLLPKIHADIIYLDPPYTGTMNNYFGFYGLIDEYIFSKKIPPFKNNFLEKKQAIKLFYSLFTHLQNFKYWIMSYNNASFPKKNQFLTLFEKLSTNIQIIEIPHIYKVTGKENKQANTEILFVIENTNFKPKETLFYEQSNV